jgi:hypothetical protein
MCEIITFIGAEAAKTIIALATTAIVGAVVWSVTIRNRTTKLLALVANPNRSFILYYRGEEEKEKHKTITFKADGAIGGKPNSNEHHWKISWGTLKLYTSGDVKFSEFTWDRKQGRLIHTNNPILPSVMGQYIVPSVIPASSQPHIYRKSSSQEEGA